MAGRNLARDIYRFLFPLFVIMGAMFLFLRLLNALPSYLQPETLREEHSVATVAEAEAVLKRKLLLPSYFPEYLLWPPGKITVQQRPVPFVRLVVYARTGIYDRAGQMPVLIIHQGSPGIIEEGTEPLLPFLLLTKETVRLGQVAAELSTYRAKDGQPWYRLSWPSEGQAVVVTSSLPLKEVLRMASSMNR